ncbi:MAG TPA: hypothetical protein PLG21_18900, partial [Anaerolineae bacterium]|nr:hypothetical protein [Anaerolineae bacterium]
MTRATTTLPAHYRRQAALDLAKDARMLAGAIALGTVLLAATGWLSLRLIGLLRPSALDGLRL